MHPAGDAVDSHTIVAPSMAVRTKFDRSNSVFPNAIEKAAMTQESKVPGKKNNDNVRAVGRALDILKAFTVTDYELTTNELLKRVDLSRPTLYRLIYTLEQSGFLVSVGEPQKFRLGPSVAHLVHVWTSSLNLSETARPMLHCLWESTGETSALFIAQGAYRTCIAEIASVQPLSYRRGIGYRAPIMRGAGGYAIVAFSDISQDELRQYAEGLDLDLVKFAQNLLTVRKCGYAVSFGELVQGTVSIAAPFYDGSGVVGSMVVFGPQVRLDAAKIEQIGKLLVIQTRALSAVLGKKFD
jgi:IclR family acetate operon transcriptional repressor